MLMGEAAVVESGATGGAEASPVDAGTEIQPLADAQIPAEGEGAPDAEGAAGGEDDAATVPEWDKELLGVAQEHGFSKDDYPSEAALRRAVTAFESHIAQLGRNPVAEKQARAEVKPDEQQQQQQQQQPQPQQERSVKLNRDLIADDVADEIEGALSKAISSQVDELKGLVGHIMNRDQERQFEEHLNWFDSSLTSIAEKDPAYKGIIGVGDRNSIDPKSEQFKMRERVHEAYLALMIGYPGTGKTSPSKAQLLNRALAVAAHDHQAEIERKRIAASLQKNRGRVLARPTSRTDASENGDAAALQEVVAWKKKHGL